MADPDNSIAEPPESYPSFQPTEYLYRRIPLAEVEARAISDASIPSPAFSVDREKYRANPADMLIGFPDAGVAAFMVRDVPEALESEDGRVYRFGVEYHPVEGNRAHSEVHSYHGGLKLSETGKEPPRQVRKKFRELLRQKMAILDLGQSD